jgi:hypothetical protein
MPFARDPSVLRRLVISFGEGLAFSVARRLVEDAIERPPAAALPAAPVSAVRPRAPAPTPAQIDQRVIQAIVNAVEKRLNEHAAEVPAKVQAAAAREIEAAAAPLRKQVQELRQRVEPMPIRAHQPPQKDWRRSPRSAQRLRVPPRPPLG